MNDKIEKIISPIISLERQIISFMQESRILGLSVGVIYDNNVIYTRGFGAADIKKKISATPNTLFGIGSVTKSFTALAVMQLHENGMLNVHNPVNKYLDFKLGKKNDKPITIHHLLTHSSGIPSLGTALAVIARTALDLETFVPLSSKEDFLRHINNAEDFLIYPPGEKFFYCNAGYSLLGLIIEKVSEMKYEDYIKEKIFKPLKMKRSTLKKEELERDNNVAAAYLPDKENKVRQTEHPIDFLVGAAGGIFSSVNELLLYLKTIMNDGSVDDGQLISKKSLEQILTPHIEVPQSFYGKAGYGYGWLIQENFFGYKVIAHGGSTLVSGAYVAFIPEKKIGIVVLANNGTAPLSVLGDAILVGLLGKDPQKELPPLVIRAKFNQLVGQYANYKGLVKPKVMLRDGLLYVETEIPGLPKRIQPLIPEDISGDNYKFYTYNMGIKMPVEFIVKSPNEIYLVIERDIYHKVG